MIIADSSPFETVAKRPQRVLLPRRQGGLQQNHGSSASGPAEQASQGAVPASRVALEDGPGQPLGEQRPEPSTKAQVSHHGG